MFTPPRALQALHKAGHFHLKGALLMSSVLLPSPYQQKGCFEVNRSIMGEINPQNKGGVKYRLQG